MRRNISGTVENFEISFFRNSEFQRTCRIRNCASGQWNPGDLAGQSDLFKAGKLPQIFFSDRDQHGLKGLQFQGNFFCGLTAQVMAQRLSWTLGKTAEIEQSDWVKWAILTEFEAFFIISRRVRPRLESCFKICKIDGQIKRLRPWTLHLEAKRGRKKIFGITFIYI